MPKSERAVWILQESQESLRERSQYEEQNANNTNETNDANEERLQFSWCKTGEQGRRERGRVK